VIVRQELGCVVIVARVLLLLDVVVREVEVVRDMVVVVEVEEE
jgi:hypothetical protein